jgi:amino acid adenylation domain-containing protein
MTTLQERLKKLTPRERAALESRLFRKATLSAEKLQTKIIAQKDHSPAPLSFAQQRLWYLNRLEPEGSAYNLLVGFRVQDELDLILLEKCFTEMVQRHESLRTIFRLQNNKPVQVIISPRSCSIEFVDLTNETSREKSEMLLKLAEHLYRRPFELGEWPLFRVAMARLAEHDHVVVMALHHIITDAWSLEVFFREIGHLYEAYKKDEPPQLPILPIQYADYAIWQEKWMQGKKFHEDLAYWKGKLEGDLIPLNLPADYDRPLQQTTNGEHEKGVLGYSEVVRLRKLAGDNQATVNMVLLTVFKVLLYRLSGQTDILVGSPIAGRNHEKLENLIGFFINTLVLRSDLSGDPPFATMLSRVRQTSLEAFTHQEFPFEKIVEILSPDRDMGRAPVFQVFFNYIKVQTQNQSKSYLPVKEFNSFQFESKFDITLYIFEEEKQIRLTLAYNTNVFKKQRMVEFLHQYCSIVRQVLENSQTTINTVDLVTPFAAHVLPKIEEHLPVLWEEHILDRIHTHAQATPDTIAIEYDTAVLSYRQLEQAVHFYAHKLEQHGISQGEIVAVIGERSIDFVCTLLAIMRIGGVFSILDPLYPSHRLGQLVNELGPRFLLPIGADTETIEAVTRYVRSSLLNTLEIVRCESYEEMLKNPSDKSGRLSGVMKQDPDDPAYILFTSGTTGLPKAIGSSMRPLSHFLSWYVDNFAITPDDRFALLSGLSHDPVLRDLFAPLWAGATLCIPSQRDILNQERLNNWLESSHISVLHLTPAVGLLMTNASNGDHLVNEGRFKDLRYLFFGGDVLTAHHVRLAHKFAPNAEVVNFYGATETPQVMGFHRIPKSDLATLENQSGQPVPLGKGIQDVQLLVVNQKGKLAGIGEIGEIRIRTPYLSKGYINDIEATNEKFISHEGLEKDRIYRTGDLGRYSCDGQVEYIRRADRQLNINGFRIEPGDIESCLRQHPAVTEALVTVKHNDSGIKLLVAFIRAGNDIQLEEIDIKRYVGERLPVYMVPSRVSVLSDFPLTSNGKIDRSRLLQLFDPIHNTSEFNEPKTRIEQLMAELWKKALKVEKVSSTDNFFEIGGHSLLSIELIAAIEKTTGIAIGPREFMYQTLGQLSEVLEKRIEEKKRSEYSETSGNSIFNRIKNAFSLSN